MSGIRPSPDGQRAAADRHEQGREDEEAAAHDHAGDGEDDAEDEARLKARDRAGPGGGGAAGGREQGEQGIAGQAGPAQADDQARRAHLSAHDGKPKAMVSEPQGRGADGGTIQTIHEEGCFHGPGARLYRHSIWGQR
jgi:hypothetical protein